MKPVNFLKTLESYIDQLETVDSHTEQKFVNLGEFISIYKTKIELKIHSSLLPNILYAHNFIHFDFYFKYKQLHVARSYFNNVLREWNHEKLTFIRNHKLENYWRIF